MQWANMAKLPVRFTSKVKDEMFDGKKEAGIVISTYSKLAKGKAESLAKLTEIDFGLVIMDEV